MLEIFFILEGAVDEKVDGGVEDEQEVVQPKVCGSIDQVKEETLVAL